MCGDTGDVPLAETRHKTGMSFIRKPFSLDSLADKVSDALSHDTGAASGMELPGHRTLP